MLAVFAGALGRYDSGPVFDTANPNLEAEPTVAELAEEPDIGSPRVVAQFQVPSGDHWFGTDRFGRDICAGGAITLLVMAFNLLGDALRDVLDPRLRGI